MFDVTLHAHMTVTEPEQSMMLHGLMPITLAFSFNHVDDIYIMLDARFHGDQVVRDEFMNDTDAESQALAAQCLQVLLPAHAEIAACHTHSASLLHCRTRLRFVVCFHEHPQNGPCPWFSRGEVCMMRLHKQPHTR